MSRCLTITIAFLLTSARAYEGPEPAKIHGDKNDTVTGELYKPLYIRCLANRYPASDVYWTRNKHRLPVNDTVYEIRENSLLIRSLRIVNLGEYSCHADNGVENSTSWSVLVCAYKPEGFPYRYKYLVNRNTSTTSYPSTITAAIGKTSTSSITDPLDFTDPIVATTYEETEYVTTEALTNEGECFSKDTDDKDTDTIIDSKDTDTVSYTGAGITTYTETSAPPGFNETEASVTEVVVNSDAVSPDVLASPSERGQQQLKLTAAEGSKATLRCHFNSRPQTKIAWKRGDFEIDCNVGRYRLTSEGALEIVCLYRNDTGVYICVADNGLGTATQEINLVVTDPKDTRVKIAGDEESVITGDLGKPLVIRCLAYGYPDPVVFWTRDNVTVLHNNDHYEITRYSLLIKNLTVENLGQYICQTYNGIGSVLLWPVLVRAYRPEGFSIEHEYLVTQNVVNTTTSPELITTMKAAISSTAEPHILSKDFCKLVPEDGKCDSYFIMWYYDDVESACMQFVYTGCGGNNNRFGSREDCESECKPVVANITVAPIINHDVQHACITPSSLTPCGYNLTVFYYDSNTKSCLPSEFGGCRHPNSYRSEEECERQCGAFRGEVDVCQAILDPGPCRNPVTKYYFDALAGRCESFTYGGCAGGPNRFSSVEECEEICENIKAGVPPKVLSHQESNVTNSEGNKATLRCLFTAEPPPEITWRRGDIKIDCNVGRYRLTSEGALEIVSLYRNDTGVYICVADNGLGTATQEINLVVTDPKDTPVNIAGDENGLIIGELNKPLTIRCLAYGYPVPDVYWSHENFMVPFNDAVFEIRGNSLLIRNMSIETLGQYTCQAYNGIGKAASWVVLVRAYRPEGYFIEHDYLVARNNVITTRHTPLPTTVVTTTTTSTTTERPVIFTVPVNVHVTSTYNTLNIGAELRLRCEVDGFPEPTVYWTKDGQPLLCDERISITGTTISRLSIVRLTVTDSGLYECHAHNEYSTHSESVQINVKSIVVPADCTDHQRFANHCPLIVRSRFCSHKYYAKFCCKSCVESGQLVPLKFEA